MSTSPFKISKKKPKMDDQRGFIATLWQAGKPVSDAIATTNDCYVAKAFHLNSVRRIYAVCANQGVEKGAKDGRADDPQRRDLGDSFRSPRSSWGTAWTVATLQLAMAAMAVRVSLTSDLTAAFRASKSSGRSATLVGVGTAAAFVASKGFDVVPHPPYSLHRRLAASSPHPPTSRRRSAASTSAATS